MFPATFPTLLLFMIISALPSEVETYISSGTLGVGSEEVDFCAKEAFKLVKFLPSFVLSEVKSPTFTLLVSVLSSVFLLWATSPL